MSGGLLALYIFLSLIGFFFLFLAFSQYHYYKYRGRLKVRLIDAEEKITRAVVEIMQIQQRFKEESQLVRRRVHQWEQK